MPPEPHDEAALRERVAARLDDVRDRIRRAGGTDVDVVAVTKTFGVEHARAAVAAGCRWIGENYAQEVTAKWADRGSADFGLQFIGQLQTNKVRSLVGIVDLFASVDRPSLVVELAKRSPGAHVLVQVAPDAGQAGKGGCAIVDVPALVDAALDAGLVVDGLMTVGLTVGGPEASAAGFRAVRALVDRLGLTVCSMGMSDDLEVAVREGSNQVRIGSALFGERSGRR